MRSFDARVTGMLYRRIEKDCPVNDRNSIEKYLANLTPSEFLEHVNAIEEEVFDRRVLSAGPDDDQEFVAQCRFIQQMETYKTLKHAIKYADIGTIKRVIARCCAIFHGSKKRKYAFLSLYMTWLTQTDAATQDLQTAILTNGLVNLRGAENGWFEMDRLNEFFNLQMKNLMATRRTSTQLPQDLFDRVAMTASYCTDLKSAMDRLTGSFSNGRHQPKDASEDVYRLAYELYKIGSVTHCETGRQSTFNPVDVVQSGTGKVLADAVDKFNNSQFGNYEHDDERNLPIAVLDETTAVGDDSDSDSE